ncbi:MAG: hypothetical protein WA421_18550 [Nitrososphaeraceae archaeon]
MVASQYIIRFTAISTLGLIIFTLTLAVCVNGYESKTEAAKFKVKSMSTLTYIRNILLKDSVEMQVIEIALSV